MERTHSTASIFLIAFFTSLVTAVVTVILVMRFNLVPVGGTVAVPDLRGSKKVTAQANLDNKGLVMLIGGYETTQTTPPDTVISQTPLPGSKVDKGTTVTITLASRAPAVPDLKGRTVAEATLLVEQAGFKIRIGEPVANEKIAEGKIATQVPPAGSAYEAGRSVMVSPSDGPGALPVPKFVGMPNNRAKEAIQKAGFTVGEIKWTYNEDWNPYMVLKQTPEAGAKAKPGSKIDLVVNED